MSQIETIMMAVLVLAVVALIALFAGRAGSTLTAKLKATRTVRDAPARMAAMQAERDQLRAEYAMLTRKMEMRLDEVKTELAEQTSEVSRNRNRLDHMVQEVQKRDATIAEHETQSASMQEHIASLQDDLANRTETIQTLKQELSQREAEIAELAGKNASLQTELAERMREIRTLEEELERAPSAPELTQQATEAQTKLQERIDHLTALSSEIKRQRRDLDTQYETFVAKQQQLRAETGEDETTGGVENAAAAAPSPNGQDVQEASKAGTASKKPSRKSAGKAVKKSTKGKKSRKSAKKQTPKLAEVDGAARELDGKIETAAKEDRDLKAELAKLDKVWSQKLDELKQVADSSRKPKPESVDGTAAPEANGASGNGEAVSGTEQAKTGSLKAITSLSRRRRMASKSSADS